MSQISNINDANQLLRKINLPDSQNPINNFLDHPTPYNFKQIPKDQLTNELAMTAIEKNAYALEYVPIDMLSYDICIKTVERAPYILRYIPDKFLTQELLLLAIRHDPSLIEFVPKEKITSEIASEAIKCTKSITSRPQYAIYYIPEKLYSQDLILSAICNAPNCIANIPSKRLTKELCTIAVQHDGCAIKYVPKKYIDSDIIKTAVYSSPQAIKYLSKDQLNRKLCVSAIKADASTLQYIPVKYLNESLVKSAIKKSPRQIKFLPKEFQNNKIYIKAVHERPDIISLIPLEFQTVKLWLTAINRSVAMSNDYRFPLNKIPFSILNNKTILKALLKMYSAKEIIDWNDSKCTISTIDGYEYSHLDIECIRLLENKITQKIHIDTFKPELPNSATDGNDISKKTESMTVRDFSDSHFGNSSKLFYYISDIHIEHQIPAKKHYDLHEISKILDDKIDEMTSGASDKTAILLVGGDISSNMDLTLLFYKKLAQKWYGQILFVLGNHEFWDNRCLTAEQQNHFDSAQTIINEYQTQLVQINEQIAQFKSDYNSSAFLRIDTLPENHIFGSPLMPLILLQNSLYICYKNECSRVISEEEILSASVKDLTEICRDSSTIILGGVGFSGLNPHYNAELKLYRTTITSLDADRQLSDAFRKVYDKLRLCTSDKQVIVLTHTPVTNWTNDPINPEWIYVNGHTHSNGSVRSETKGTVLFDGQIGYTPKPWVLHGFSLCGWYDPFKDFSDGIHIISRESYNDFNIGRDIQTEGCNREGTIFCLKKQDIYMFMLKNQKSLYLLSGGRITKLSHGNLQFYYDNMELYSNNIRKIMQPYCDFQKKIADEVKRFGGNGTIHGSIVDIDFYNHIYINPNDLKITPYYALDISERTVYRDIPTLLQNKSPLMYSKFLTIKNQLSLLQSSSDDQTIYPAQSAEISMISTEREIYSVSKTIKALQYLIDFNVIRIWNDDIISPQQNRALSPSHMNGIFHIDSSIEDTDR